MHYRSHYTALLASLVMCSAVRAGTLFDLASAGRLSSWDDAGPRRFANIRQTAAAANLGLEWDEERDVREIRVNFVGPVVKGAHVEYWFRNWPYPPPKMPSFEDPMDDPWQGKWLNGVVSETCQASECTYRFDPLTAEENPNAENLPRVRYRRTLKVRLVYPANTPPINSLRMYSGSEEAPVRMRVELTSGGSSNAQWTASASVYNGRLSSAITSTAGGFTLNVIAAKPDLPGSHDATVVTFHATRMNGAKNENRRFSFAVDDLKNGPIVIPEFHARVVDLQGLGAPAAQRKEKLRVRQRIPLEPEQTYERAFREIPPLDPWEREWGGRVYLPLAPDSDWQKFAFEYGGDVFISKTGIKAKGRELARLQWEGDRITWRLGTGAKPYYRDDHKVTVRKLDGYLPVITQTWEQAGIQYTEEAFATVLRGRLSPENRDERTPAVLMVRLTAKNRLRGSLRGHVWLSVDHAGALTLDGRTVSGNWKVVAAIDGAINEDISLEAIPSAATKTKGVHIGFDLAAAGERSIILKIPCVSDLDPHDLEDLKRLNYDPERARTVAYWEQLVGRASRFSVPEPKFNLLARSVVAQIHISTTKDSATGLYMVPAASYVYNVFENESCYQVLLLDTLGQFDTAAEYLETMMRLQGSKNFPGLQKGSIDGVFHGVKIDDTYDYTASGYGLDHGTVLWTLAQHYFYTRDRAWLEHAWPHMQRAIDWIERQRSTTKLTDLNGQKVREYGLLPASQLEDDVDWANWFSVNAFSWAGMERTAAALEDAGNPAGAKIKVQADAFRNDLRTAILRAVETAPVARMQDGTYEPYVPVVPTRRFRLFGPIRADYYNRYGHPEMKPLMRLAADRDTLCGAVVLLLLGVFSPDEPIANWILDDWEDNETLSSGMNMNIHGMTDDRYWFSQGGMVFQANLVNPIQIYLLRHEVPAAIRNLYNDFVACLYPDVNIFTEEFHQWRHGSGPFYKISDESRFTNRLRDILAFEDKDTLWLAPGVPRRWLASPEGITVNQLQTFFGPLTYSMHAAATAGEVDATIQLPTRNPAKKAWLVARVPHGSIKSVMLDGKPWTQIDTRLEAIALPQNQSPLKLQIRYQ